ncbi:MAG: hypothetical protein HDS01_03145 [Bacteroides sp.]|nr:hypothetical protein [Bacteroides sp.]
MSSENKKITKNTLFLYLRMGIVMLIKLYVARILLEALGIDDYGVWNILASFVISFQFISAPIVVSTQRFLNYDMGQGGHKLNRIFNLSFELILSVSILLILGFETVGKWFIENKLNFEPGMMPTVAVLYQLTIFSLVFQLIQKPFESTVIAHERMSFYAYITLFEAFFLLGITILLKSDISENKLIWYGSLNMLLYALEFSGYWVYCRLKFQCCRLKLVWDKALAKEIGVFSGWNLFGGLSSMTANQGINVLLNIFFGVAVNAAFGISNQVKGAITMLIINLQKAFDPQIVKNYSIGNMERMHKLTVSIISLSYLLALIVVFPLCLNIDFILSEWLGNEIPAWTNWFCILTLLQMLFVALGGPIDTAVFATGKIKSYQLWLSGEIFLNIIFVYIFFRLSYGPVWAFVVKLLVEGIITATRFIFLRRVGLSLSTSIRRIIIPLFSVSIVACGLCYAIITLLSIHNGWLNFICTVFLFVLIVAISGWYLLLDRSLKDKIYHKLAPIFTGKS